MDALLIDEISCDPVYRFVDLCADRGNSAASEFGAFHKGGFVSGLLAIIDLG